jgi:HK97 family phage major capsid protein
MAGIQVQLGFQQPVLDDLIPELRTNQGAIKYMEETVATNGAAAVAEGATKPESALDFEEKIAPVRKIATVLPVTDEMFEDEPMMRDYAESRLRFFMDLRREAQIIGGSGVAPNLTGILTTSGIQVQAKGTDPGPDAVYKAMTLVRTGAFLQADATVWNPADWQEVKLLRTADGIYIWGNPADGGPDRIWGLPAIQTTALTAGTVLVGAFRASSAKFRRSEVTFSVSDQHGDFFITNKLMLRVEERLAFVVFRPAGFVTVTGM